jgi:hypothetical protein
VDTGTPDKWTGQQVFASELMAGETVEWFGQPDPSVLFTRADIFLIPFSLLWGGFALFWEASALGMVFKSKAGGRPPDFFALFGLPFVVIGLYFIFGRFIYKKWRKKNTYYAVTNKRVIILTKLWRKSIQAIRLISIPTMNKSAGRNGTGSIVFGNASPANQYGNTGMELLGTTRGEYVPAFYDIPDVDAVYELVNRLMEAAERRF